MTSVPLDLSLLIPADISSGAALFLIIASLFTSLITAALGLGGGMLMLSLMTIFVPPAAIIPVHGVVQLGSNSGRAWLQRAHIRWDIVIWLALGAIPGALLGASVASYMPGEALLGAIGAFILITTWLPLPSISGRGRGASFLAGALISCLSMFFGATGPLTAGFLRFLKERQELVSTHAVVMTIQHGVKVIAFTLFGFALAEYVPLLAAMIISGFVGTAIGTRILVHTPEQVFRYGFRIVLSIAALDMLRRALF